MANASWSSVAHADALRAFVGQRPHIDIGAEALRRISSTVMAHNFFGESGTSMRRMPQFCFQRS